MELDVDVEKGVKDSPSLTLLCLSQGFVHVALSSSNHHPNGLFLDFLEWQAQTVDSRSAISTHSDALEQGAAVAATSLLQSSSAKDLSSSWLRAQAARPISIWWHWRSQVEAVYLTKQHKQQEK